MNQELALCGGLWAGPPADGKEQQKPWLFWVRHPVDATRPG